MENMGLVQPSIHETIPDTHFYIPPQDPSETSVSQTLSCSVYLSNHHLCPKDSSTWQQQATCSGVLAASHLWPPKSNMVDQHHTWSYRLFSTTSRFRQTSHTGMGFDTQQLLEVLDDKLEVQGILFTVQIWPIIPVFILLPQTNLGTISL